MNSTQEGEPTPPTTAQSSGQNRNNNRGRNNNTQSVRSTEGASFEGAYPEIGVVAALRTEIIPKKAPFSVFTEKVADHVITTMKYGSDVEDCIRKMQDPKVGFSAKYKPEPLTDQDPSFDDRLLQQERIKAFVARENVLRDNITKIYGLVWRQCTSALQAVIKGDEEFSSKTSGHDLIWLLTQI